MSVGTNCVCYFSLPNYLKLLLPVRFFFNVLTSFKFSYHGYVITRSIHTEAQGGGNIFKTANLRQPKAKEEAHGPAHLVVGGSSCVVSS